MVLIYSYRHDKDECYIYETIDELLDKHLMSHIHSNLMTELIETCDFGDSTHIIGPLYTVKSGNNFQLGVGGNQQGIETIEEGIIRELGEEIGAIPRTLECRRTYRNLNTGRITTGWTCKLDDMKILSRYESSPPPDGGNNCDSPIVCLVHGTEDFVHNICIFDPIVLLPSTDTIDGIVAIPIDEAKKMIKRGKVRGDMSAAFSPKSKEKSEEMQVNIYDSDNNPMGTIDVKPQDSVVSKFYEFLCSHNLCDSFVNEVYYGEEIIKKFVPQRKKLLGTQENGLLLKTI